MPVRKFRSIEEMNQPIWRDPGTPDLYRAIREIWDFGQRTSTRRFRSGVHRYRSIEEMNAEEEQLVPPHPTKEP